jgi:hypothetical protein
MTPDERADAVSIAAAKTHNVDNFRKTFFAYGGFQMATALVVAAKAGDVPWAWLAVALLAVSVPASVPATFCLAILFRYTPDDGQRNCCAKWLALVFAIAPSVAAFSILLAAASPVAAAAFPLSCVIFGVVGIYAGKNSKN